jgi:hypothetical protein
MRTAHPLSRRTTRSSSGLVAWDFLLFPTPLRNMRKPLASDGPVVSHRGAPLLPWKAGGAFSFSMKMNLAPELSDGKLRVQQRLRPVAKAVMTLGRTCLGKMPVG